MNTFRVIVFAVLYCATCLCDLDVSSCEVATRTEQGLVCGRRRKATNGEDYASFRGIPYAKQPIGRLRFKELRPAEPFHGVFNATETGPICPQVDIFFGPLMAPRSMGEDCIRINIHVPYQFFPDVRTGSTKQLLPVFFWIHGGSLNYGSGDPDFYGPEYLMTKDIILVTINYRLNVFGFLSLGNKYIPGNNGIRDCITALKWVQKNIRNFGGDPDRVTLAGQSAGGVLAHMISVSPASKGLFKQVAALSGQSAYGMFSYSRKYASIVNAIFFIAIGINPLQPPKKVHDDLVTAPLERLMYGQKAILDVLGVVAFVPIIEIPQPGFTTVLPKEPEELVNEGAGKEYPTIIGLCSNEGIILYPRLKEVHTAEKMKMMPALTLPLSLLMAANLETIPVLTTIQLAKYFNYTNITLIKFLYSVTDLSYTYPAQRLARKRLATGAAKTYFYQFNYKSKKHPLKLRFNMTYPGAAHLEDITYFFRLNAFLGPQTKLNELAHSDDDSRMKDWMTTMISNFVINGSPAVNESDWNPCQEDLRYQHIEKPFKYNFTTLTPYMKDNIKYCNRLFKIALGV